MAAIKFADLHIHTHYSDSSLSPTEVVQEALENGLSCIGIADHDTLEGIDHVKKAAEGHDLEVLDGIELSSESHNQEIHILGYLFDAHSDFFHEQLIKMQQARIERMKLMIEKLLKVGVNNISLEEVSDLTKSDALGRMHLAMILQRKGWVKTPQQAFDKYLGEGECAYVKKFEQTPQEAIKLIREAGGVAVMAHPMATQRDEIIPSLVKAGLQGIEAFYPNCSPLVTEYYVNIAKKHHLVLTGGSDSHGAGKLNTFIGKMKIPYELVEELKKIKENF